MLSPNFTVCAEIIEAKRIVINRLWKIFLKKKKCFI